MMKNNSWVKSFGRKAMEHPLFRNNPMNYGAWMFLISMAAWKETKFDVKGKTITLQRGQLCASERQLAKQFGTSRSWITRFLARLKTETMIETDSEPGKNIITICNYSKYQDITNTCEPVIEPVIEPEANQQRTTKEESKNIIITTVENIHKPDIAIFPDFDQPEIQPSSHAFAGVVIKLNQADLQKWMSIYHSIPDLIAELHQLDDFYAGLPASEVKNWFHRAKSALNKKHQARLQARADAPALSGPSGGGIGETDYAAMRRRQDERDEEEAREIARNLAADDQPKAVIESQFA